MEILASVWLWICKGLAIFWSWICKYVELAVGGIGFLGVILTLRADHRIKVAEFIAEYNLTFLTAPQFTEVERKLEGCNDAYRKFILNRVENGETLFEEYCDKVFGTKHYQFENEYMHRKYAQNGETTPHYQSIVNYLVYLESFATLITQRRVKIKEVDDLFGYRFFIAVNNPVLQQNELLPYKQFYKGIYKAYIRWVRYYRRRNRCLCKKAHITEPMSQFALSKKI